MLTDLRYALRSLTKSPGYTAIAILIVALGIAASTTMFSIVDTLVLRPLPLPEPERLVTAYETNLSRNLPHFSVSVPNYYDWKNRSQSWKSLAAVDTSARNLTGDLEPQLVQVHTTTANYLSTLGIKTVLGRDFLESEDQPGRNQVAIITAPFWQRWFGGEADVVGRALKLDNTTYTIIGVTPPGALFPGDHVEIMIPLGAEIALMERGDRMLTVYGRLKRGITLEQADAEMKVLASQIWAEHPDLDRGWSNELAPLSHEIISSSLRQGLYVLLGAVVLLLLIACANLSNLMLVRATTRTQELAIRTALGASRWHIIRQLVTESLVVAGAGGVAGSVLMLWAVDAVHSLPLPRAGEISADFRMLAVACLTTLLTGVVAGIGPALKVSRSRHQIALKSRGTLSGQRSRLRDSMVVAQLALSLTLLVGSALLGRSFWRLLQVNPGFTSEQALTLSLRPQGNAVQFYDAVDRAISSLPQVAATGSISLLPLTSGGTENNIAPIGPAEIPPDQTVQATWRLIHGDYFSAMQIPLLQGRDFRGLAPAEARSSMIISASLARMLWGNADPIGRKIKRLNALFTVIGVVGDVRSETLGANSRPAFYMSIHRFTNGPQTLVVRSQGELAPLAAAIRQTIHQIDPTVPIFRFLPLADIRAASLQQERLLIGLLGGFAAVALLLATLGTYGVTAFTVQQRTAEIGIRIAVGAQPGNVLRLLLGQSARLAAIGLGLGLLGAFIVSRTLSSLLYATPTYDPTSYVLASVVLALAAFLACWLPALRATKIDPIMALRSE